MTAKIIATDVDGVLTDGTLTIDHKGEKLFKKFHTRDVRAIRELIYNGFEVYFITADDWPGTQHFADKVGADVIITRDKGDVKNIFQGRPFIAVGDDAWDKPMIEIAELAFCPYDAHPSVMTCNIQPLKTRGGQGVFAELIPILLKNDNNVPTRNGVAAEEL